MAIKDQELLFDTNMRNYGGRQINVTKNINN
jgi:hypothetical protein